MSDPILAKHCLTRDEVSKVGDYWINRSDPKRPMIMIMLPKDTIPSYLRLYEVSSVDGHKDDRFWTLSGPDDKPTLKPSINNPGVWHGYLTDGMLHE
jgi:hypothetical protein